MLLHCPYEFVEDDSVKWSYTGHVDTGPRSFFVQ